MTAPARDVLEVVLDGELIPGVVVYGLSVEEISDRSRLRSGTMFDHGRSRCTHLLGDHWSAAVWDIPVARWLSADDTCRDVGGVLDEVMRRGCSVAWVAAEGFPFSDPPHLFDPAHMPRSVLAWSTSAGDFGCLIDPDQPVATADTEVMLMLRRRAAGIVDSS